jgi:hypothetical protein
MSDWYKSVPVVGEIDSWFNNDSWQDRAFYKLKRAVLANIIGIDILSFGVSKYVGMTAGVISNLLWSQDFDAL